MSQITSFVFTILLQLYQLTGNLGWALIVFTFVLRSLLLPITLKSLRAQKKMRQLQPQLNKLKETHKDKKKLQQAQLELYQKHNVNPLAGCLPQVVQIGILIVLYRVLIDFLHQETVNGTVIDPFFLWMDLREPDKIILPILVGVSQLVFSLMILPGGETPDIVPNKSKSKKVQQENKKEEDMAEMAASMQKQMMFIMPAMTAFFATRFPSGLALYWVATTVFSIGQQYFVSGFGGLKTYPQRVFVILKAKLVTRG